MAARTILTTAGGAPSAPPRHRWWHASPAGLVVGTTFAALATTPSLIPRDWAFQGVASGITGAIGYGLGAGGVAVVRWWRRRTSRGPGPLERLRIRLGRRGRPATVAAWALLLVGLAALLLVVLLASAGWQQDLADLMGMEETTTTGWLRAGPATLVVALVLVAAARGVRALARRSGALLRRRLHLPPGVALGVGALLALLLVAAAVDGLVGRVVLPVADSAFAAADDVLNPDRPAPLEPTRSGSPRSLVDWDTLGVQGRKFVAGGRAPAEMAEASGGATTVPVRVYAGLGSADDPAERARLAAAELVRAGGLERSVVLLTIGTGTGWVDASATDSLELLRGGDTAAVAMQYSYLPSPLALVVDRDRSQEAARLLLDAVGERLDAVPADRRPRLLLYGESLGVVGTQAAFTSLSDVRDRTDGVVWAGPPGFSRLWSSLVERRDPGTPAVSPVYGDGLVVRFAQRPGDEDEPATPWLDPRVLYLQHASDPVVWWSPSLLWSKPDWLSEPRGTDVLPGVRWYPVVTFWQVSTDLARAQAPPDGHGHNYGDELVDAWVAVAAPDGWDEADTARLHEVFAR